MLAAEVGVAVRPRPALASRLADPSQLVTLG